MEIKEAFTPGPWKITPSEYTYEDVEIEQDDGSGSWGGNSIVTVHNCRTNNGISNAHLIAAAPDLLTAAQEAVIQAIDHAGACSFCGYGGAFGGHDQDCAATKLRAAIMKAKGQAQEGR